LYHSEHYIPVSALQTDEHGVTTTEEFSPEARRELEQEEGRGQVAKRSQALVRRKKKPASTTAKTAPAAVIGLLLAAFAAYYRQEKISIGYCGVGEPAWSLANVDNVPEWIHDTFQPQCEPCPPHAYCSRNMEVTCEDNFILQPHPLAAGGLIPLPPTCEPDSEKEKRIKVVADRAIEELRDIRAAHECGGEVPTCAPELKEVVKAGTTKLEVPEATLKELVSKQRRRGMNDAEFADLWESASLDIKARDEVEVTDDG
jgi:hypothetical protein